MTQTYDALWRKNGRSYYPVRVLSAPDRGSVRCWVGNAVVKWLPLRDVVGMDGDSVAGEVRVGAALSSGGAGME